MNEMREVYKFFFHSDQSKSSGVHIYLCYAGIKTFLFSGQNEHVSHNVFKR